MQKFALAPGSLDAQHVYFTPKKKYCRSTCLNKRYNVYKYRELMYFYYYSSEAMLILQDAPACCLPLLKFTELYEKRYKF